MNGALFWLILSGVYVAPNLTPRSRFICAWASLVAAVVVLVMERMR